MTPRPFRRYRPLGGAVLGLLGLTAFLVLAGAVGCGDTRSSERRYTALARRPGPSHPPYEEADSVCFSLRALEAELRAAASEGREPIPAARRLGGIGHLEACFLDPESGDVILRGRRRAQWPALQLEDLVVNVRAVWGGGAFPYCSLDPEPANVAEITALTAELAKTDTLNRSQAVRRRLCATWGPQRVVVGGVPRASRHARIMVGADYHMKKVSQGDARLAGIPSYVEIALQHVRERLRAGDTAVGIGARISRFWFHLAEGHPDYDLAANAVSLKACDVVLLTERKMADASGRLRDAGSPEPHAQTFASRFSEAYLPAAVQEPIYADLHNLFRLRALLEAVHFQGMLQKAGLPLPYLLRGYACRLGSDLPETLPGLAKAPQVEEVVTRGSRKYVMTFMAVVCGGVSMEMRVTRASFPQTASSRLTRLRLASLRARPHRNALCWSVP